MRVRGSPVGDAGWVGAHRQGSTPQEMRGKKGQTHAKTSPCTASRLNEKGEKRKKGLGAILAKGWLRNQRRGGARVDEDRRYRAEGRKPAHGQTHTTGQEGG